MPQPTDLFCHAIFFIKFNICASRQILREHISPHDFPVEQGDSVLHKVWTDLFLKAFYVRWGIIYWVWGMRVGGVLHRGLMISSCQGWGSFTNTFFSNHFSFFQSWRDIHLQIKPWPKLWKYLFLKLIVKRFQRLCRVQPDLDLFVMLTVQIGDCIRKAPSPDYASGIGDFMQSLPFFKYISIYMNFELFVTFASHTRTSYTGFTFT